MKTNKRKTVTGVLSPIRWNSNDEIVEYSVYTENDEDIILRGNNLDSNFKFFKNQKVKVSGNFLSSSDDLRVFQASKIQKLNKAA
ncbi:hypothetical protein A2326_03715 [candidate division WWE3 bacterium RIFOXYB2_FULL_41_6]|nr:MAG: hypothetical protein A2181_08935 [Bdellovibrionales bacterium RIFOXYA1_FULL_38_20]OFZ51217.1 MAG: hypothetical protein A2417_17420 [Bdellovibrionales bacterium RIFOXYC1_FULL_37_79]OFZ60927.1 MAG: hypothetical protein A2381_08740 [Bdellovibrionales bacterium RIFOXYB1_FULL_37_110]OFZ63671.1 MAG: hypothetical protein A2577_07860 [Bdellovibrionales bacterium RIFOXYD1_FULL_36_51]OGC64591.1 MAG: hypothetical protein A2326_03715 [candidate division WWE3 bacterium RIFOXYB2_FULL_41_6]